MRNQNNQTVKAFVICESHIFRSGLRTILEAQAIDVIGEESIDKGKRGHHLPLPSRRRPCRPGSARAGCSYAHWRLMQILRAPSSPHRG